MKLAVGGAYRHSNAYAFDINDAAGARPDLQRAI